VGPSEEKIEENISPKAKYKQHVYLWEDPLAGKSPLRDLRHKHPFYKKKKSSYRRKHNNYRRNKSCYRRNRRC